MDVEKPSDARMRFLYAGWQQLPTVVSDAIRTPMSGGDGHCPSSLLASHGPSGDGVVVTSAPKAGRWISHRCGTMALLTVWFARSGGLARWGESRLSTGRVPFGGKMVVSCPESPDDRVRDLGGASPPRRMRDAGGDANSTSNPVPHNAKLGTMAVFLPALL